MQEAECLLAQAVQVQAAECKPTQALHKQLEPWAALRWQLGQEHPAACPIAAKGAVLLLLEVIAWLLLLKAKGAGAKAVVPTARQVMLIIFILD